MVKTRVLVVDDSAFMRKVLTDMINADERLEVCGFARDGEEAIQKAKTLDPDVITMDIEMPVMDGISALKNLLKEKKIPVIMVSAFTEAGSNRTIEAMEAGAFDFLLKPDSLSDQEILDKLQKEIIDKILSSTKAKVMKYESQVSKAHTFNPTRKKILLIASSTGGPQTLEYLITRLPKNIPAPILIVQHMPPVFTKSLADRLNKLSEIEVREAKEGDTLKNGLAYIAPGDFHMTLEPEFEGHEGSIRLLKTEREQGVRPCANVLFRSVSPIYKENIIAVILSGMGSDGTEGAREIKRYHGTIIAQSEKDCILYGMPKAVKEAELADEVIDLDKLSVAIVQLLEV